jgi:hypothetical protein
MKGARIAAMAAGTINVVTGLYAFFAPEAFFRRAPYPPYNEHFIHDIGAFLVGLGVVLLLAAWFSSALFVALAGVAAGTWLHFAAHLMDRDQVGGAWRDVLFTGVLGAVLTAGALAVKPARSLGIAKRSR